MARPKNVSLIFGIVGQYDSVGRDVMGDAMGGIESLVEFASSPDPDPLHQRVRDLLENGPVMRCQACDVTQRTHATRCDNRIYGDDRTCGGSLKYVPDVDLPDWMRLAEHNLVEMLRKGGLYLRRCACPSCDAFFVCRDKRQRICSNPDCLRAVKADRDRRNSKVRRDRSKAALLRRDVRRKNGRV